MNRKPHLALVLDTKNLTVTKQTLKNEAPKPPSIDRDPYKAQIAKVSFEGALNGGYAIRVTYTRGKSVLLLCESKVDLLESLSKLVPNDQS